MNLQTMLQNLPHTLLQGSIQAEISALVYDSRKVTPGSLFVCVTGTVADGHKYIPMALEKGATALVVEHPVEVPAHITVLQVESGRRALAELSAAWFGYPARQLTTVAVTGTKGKTTTTYMIHRILEEAGHTAGLIGTVEILTGAERIAAEHTTPESYEIHRYLRQMADNGCRYAIMEVSSQALKLDRTAGIRFDYGIFTNLTPDHLSPLEHASMEEYAACKALLFRQCRVGLFNADSAASAIMMEGCTCRVETYALHAPAHWQATADSLGRKGIRLQLTAPEVTDLFVDLPGEFSAYNALSALAVCRHMGIDWDRLSAALAVVQVRGRMERLPLPNGSEVMIDYAHNAVSLESLLTALRPCVEGRLICVFGCGGNRARDRRFDMGAVSARLADVTVVTSDNPRFEDPMQIIRDIETGVHNAGGTCTTIPDRKEAIRWAIDHAAPEDLVILAGKGHELGQEIQGVVYPMDERSLVAQVLSEGARQQSL